MTSSFAYQPLEEESNDIRLVQIIDDPSASQLRCSIIHASLDEPPPYLALSYTWQRPVPTQLADVVEAVSTATLSIDGRTLEIGTNLGDALRYLHAHQLGLFWVDAICIDQKNLDERSEQVARMRSIYSKAQRVLVWLGPAANNSDMAMDLLMLLAQRADGHNAVAWLENNALEPKNFEAWKALRDLLSRNWWKRSWVIQEFALGHEVDFVCGGRRLTCSQLGRADQLLFNAWPKIFDKETMLKIGLNGRAQDPMRNLLKIRRYLQSGKTISLLTCLSMTRESLASNPRDYIFAKLGLFGPRATEICRPDYRRSTYDICKTFAESYISNEKDLYIICLAGMTPRRVASFPSWLPDWGSARPAYPLRCSWAENLLSWPHYDAARGTKADVEFLHNETILKCHGILCDEIDGVSFDPWVHQEQDRMGLQSLYNNCAYLTDQESFQALCRTVTADTNRWIEPSKAPEDFALLFARRCRECDDLLRGVQTRPGHIPAKTRPGASNFEKRWQGMRDLRLGAILLQDLVKKSLARLEACGPPSEAPTQEPTRFGVKHHALWPAFEHSMGQVMYHRRVFTTKNGYLGVGSRTLTRNDKIYVLFGCNVPLVLRPRDRQYELIGECYVHGIMNGEFMNSLDLRKPQSTSVELC